MTRQEAIDFLSVGSRTGRLATASPTGKPHVAPVWFMVDGEDLVFTTSERSVKGRNLRANPRAAMAVDVSEYPYAFVTVRGPVRIDGNPEDMVDWATKLAVRYVPAGRAREYGERNAGADELLCRLHMDQIRGVSDIAL